METEGFHVLVDAFLCDENVINHMHELQKRMIILAETLEMRVIHTYFHPFHPQGVTGVLVLSSSHMSIHTWPEKRYASLDVYTCGKKNPMNELEKVLTAFGSEYAVVYDILRGNQQIVMPNVHQFWISP